MVTTGAPSKVTLVHAVSPETCITVAEMFDNSALMTAAVPSTVVCTAKVTLISPMNGASRCRRVPAGGGAMAATPVTRTASGCTLTDTEMPRLNAAASATSKEARPLKLLSATAAST